MSNQDTQLQNVRARIDAIDEQVQRLIEERATCAQRIAELKGSDSAGSFYRPEREAQVLRNVAARHQGPLPMAEVTRIFREIMSSCLALELPMDIAYLGPAGTYTHQAALKQFGHGVRLSPQSSIDDIFRAVAAGRCHYGVAPVENSTEGSVNQTMDNFRVSPLAICGEVVLRIQHQLLSRALTFDALRTVYGHPQALAQCRRWLEVNLPNAIQTSMPSNGEAVKRAATEESAAAIASIAAGEMYQVPSLASNIEDEPDNTTRFWVIGERFPSASGSDKTSLLVVTGNQPGTLHRVLSPFAQHGISMTRIESRPSRRGTWDYVFYIDIEGHAQDESIAAALAEARQHASEIKVLGAYPRAAI